MNKELLTSTDALQVLQWRVEPLTLGRQMRLHPCQVEASWTEVDQAKPLVEMPVTHLWVLP